MPFKSLEDKRLYQQLYYKSFVKPNRSTRQPPKINIKQDLLISPETKNPININIECLKYPKKYAKRLIKPEQIIQSIEQPDKIEQQIIQTPICPIIQTIEQPIIQTPICPIIQSIKQPDKIEPVIIQTIKQPDKIEPVIIQTIEQPDKIEPVIIQTIEQPDKIEPVIIQTIKQPDKIEPVIIQTIKQPDKIEQQIIQTPICPIDTLLNEYNEQYNELLNDIDSESENELIEYKFNDEEDQNGLFYNADIYDNSLFQLTQKNDILYMCGAKLIMNMNFYNLINDNENKYSSITDIIENIIDPQEFYKFVHKSDPRYYLIKRRCKRNR